jgi:hypothetical protein
LTLTARPVVASAPVPARSSTVEKGKFDVAVGEVGLPELPPLQALANKARTNTELRSFILLVYLPRHPFPSARRRFQPRPCTPSTHHYLFLYGEA